MNISFPNVKLDIAYLPKSFQIFGFEITMYGIVLAIALMIGTAVVVLEAKRRHQSPNKYLGIIIVALIGGVIGARLYYVLQYLGYYKNHPQEIYNVFGGGFALYGAIFVAAIFVYVYCIPAKIRFGTALDTLTPGILMAQAIGVWGNLFNREAFGEYTNSILAMRIPIADVRPQEVTELMRQNVVMVEDVSYIQAHPLFLYECIWCLILMLIILGISRKRHFAGEQFLKYLVGYSLARGIMEWFRTDRVSLYGTKFSLTLLVSAVVFVVSLIVLIVCEIMSKRRENARKQRKEMIYQQEERINQEEMQETPASSDKEETEKIIK